MFDWRV